MSRHSFLGGCRAVARDAPRRVRGRPPASRLLRIALRATAPWRGLA
jgi:hypothetical protein